jgi:hypothetical protein
MMTSQCNHRLFSTLPEWVFSFIREFYGGPQTVRDQRVRAARKGVGELKIRQLNKREVREVDKKSLAEKISRLIYAEFSWKRQNKGTN